MCCRARTIQAIKGEAFAAGANDYLVKLPDRIELIARIRYHTRAYLDHVQRDAAYRALRESQRQLIGANLELERLTRIDGLTGLGNRRYSDEYLASEWKRAFRAQSPLSLLMIDADNFKRYNDTYGHMAGDEVLKQIARVIQGGSGRSTYLAARSMPTSSLTLRLEIELFANGCRWAFGFGWQRTGSPVRSNFCFGIPLGLD
ncbi:diguanylate cyclase [Mesorhizobium sp. M0938]|uniref:GGDEF domain-containing protein n=1 Tax=unclassified Mesorhizobium TaxID=325217 RepID=UPI003337C55D